MTMSQDSLPKDLLHIVMLLLESALEDEKNEDRDQDSLKKDLLHSWPWPSGNSFSK